MDGRSHWILHCRGLNKGDVGMVWAWFMDWTRDGSGQGQAAVEL